MCLLSEISELPCPADFIEICGHLILFPITTFPINACIQSSVDSVACDMSSGVIKVRKVGYKRD